MKRYFLTIRQTLRLLSGILPKLDVLGHLIPKLVALKGILERFEMIDSRITELDVLQATAAIAKLESLDASLKRIERIALSQSLPVQVAGITNGHDVKRLQVLSKFSQMSGKATEIEDEWRRIQQDENDALCAFQTTLKEDSKQDYMHKKGIVQGIKWCIDHFC